MVVEPLASPQSVLALLACSTVMSILKINLTVAFYEVRWNNLDLWNFLWIVTKQKKALLAINVLSKGASEINGITGIWIST